jgi:DNA helicase II / ATP-dependent DNA helicase PcrA
MAERQKVPDTPKFGPPAIEAADIAWACSLMGLPATAFAGVDGINPRLAALTSMSTLDIEACPGSGKTTLLVAKLAILANKWSHHRRGICVLSHTNSARDEIATKLRSSSVGSALPRYPHFVGTIHSFVNEFLAAPWLRSEGYPIKAIDTEIALNVRWSKVPYRTKTYLDNRNRDKYCVSYDRADFGGGKKISLGEHTQTYQALVKICEETSRSGYFCHDEMFVWASQLLDSCPHIIEAIRLRFPFVFIDEVQDNSELQSAFLHRIFCAGERPAIRQRFGDSNQAIYQSPEQSGATSDQFPGLVKADLPHSFRFGQVIADLANPLGVVPQGLVGRGPPQDKLAVKDRPSALILFDDQTVLCVLPEYAKYLLASFSTEELHAGLFTAVAGVHVPKGTGNVPRFLGHYAPLYDPDISSKESSSETFIQYISCGRREMLGHTDVYPIVSKTAAATLRLAQLADADLSFSRRKSSHRYVLELLEDKAEVCQSYLGLVDHLIRCGGEVAELYWNEECKPYIAEVAAAIAGKPAISSECNRFLEWAPSLLGVVGAHRPETPDNVYRYPPEAPKVNIRLGSIHSVKGETHTATLVLDSFFHKHHLKELKPWLLGTKSGGTSESERMIGRLKLHYVAMTRPSHLLCLAMRRDALSYAEIATLTARGWHIIDCAGPNKAPSETAPA